MEYQPYREQIPNDNIPKYSIATFFAFMERTELDVLLEKKSTDKIYFNRLAITDPCKLPALDEGTPEHQALLYIIEKASTLSPFPKSSFWFMSIDHGLIKEAGKMSAELFFDAHVPYDELNISIYEALDNVIPLAKLRVFIGEIQVHKSKCHKI